MMRKFLQVLPDFQDSTPVLEVEERDFFLNGTRRKVILAFVLVNLLWLIQSGSYIIFYFVSS